MKGKVNAQRRQKNIGLDEIAKCKEQRITKAVFSQVLQVIIFQFAYAKDRNQAAKHIRQQNFIKI